ncbi:MAG: hypothetical protein QM579_01915 [Desulfovibrio sp.]|uniref:hypothetical protein n=1 Tax=Desulfovibrio sp. TaxID=885 RepID=UPI0039E28FAB
MFIQLGQVLKLALSKPESEAERTSLMLLKPQVAGQKSLTKIGQTCRHGRAERCAGIVPQQANSFKSCIEKMDSSFVKKQIVCQLECYLQFYKFLRLVKEKSPVSNETGGE